MSKVLVLDDDQPICEALGLIFQIENIDCKFSDGNENVFKLIESFQPTIIFLDVLLSPKDGRVIAKDLKSNWRTKNIPVFFLSATAGVDKMVEQCGVQGYIPKPFEMNELLDIIKKYG